MQQPGLWKLEPAVVLKPWGLVHREALELSGIRVGVGEFWLASAQTGPGNYSNTVAEPPLRRTLADLLREAADAGDSTLEDLIGPNALSHLREHPHRGKTEAWLVRAARGRVGVAAGPASAEAARRLQEIIQTEGLPPDIPSWPDEVRGLFGLIEPLEGGEVFFVPAGTLHTMFAIGPESVLVIDELQQGYGDCLLPTLSKILIVQDDLLSVQVHPDDRTVADAAAGRLSVEQDLQANPTVRIYDFGRRPGEYPELGFRLVDPDAGLRRVRPVTVRPRAGCAVEAVMADARLAKCRVTLDAGAACGLQPLHGSYHAVHCLQGKAEVRAGGDTRPLLRGETLFVPACLEGDARIGARSDCVLLDDVFPDVAALKAFLGEHGAPPEQVEALLNPQRALPGGN